MNNPNYTPTEQAQKTTEDTKALQKKLCNPYSAPKIRVYGAI